MIKRFTYVSKAVAGLSQQNVADFIATAQISNKAQDLTGMLLFMDGYFLQVLEGPVDAAQHCLTRIKADIRHNAIDIRQSLEADVRLFPKLWMALRDSKNINQYLLSAFNYEAGFPAEKFPVDKLQRFMVALSLDAWPANSELALRRA
jgi:hypothetical protein